MNGLQPIRTQQRKETNNESGLQSIHNTTMSSNPVLSSSSGLFEKNSKENINLSNEASLKLNTKKIPEVIKGKQSLSILTIPSQSQASQEMNSSSKKVQLASLTGTGRMKSLDSARDKLSSQSSPSTSNKSLSPTEAFSQTTSPLMATVTGELNHVSYHQIYSYYSLLHTRLFIYLFIYIYIIHIILY